MTDDLNKLEEDIRAFREQARAGKSLNWEGILSGMANRLKVIREQPDDLEEILAEIIKTIDVMGDASRTASNAATKRIEALEAAQKQLLHRVAPENWEKRLEELEKEVAKHSKYFRDEEIHHIGEDSRLEKRFADLYARIAHLGGEIATEQVIRKQSERAKCLEFDPKAICDVVDRSWSATKSGSGLHWWFESGEYFFPVSDGKDFMTGVLRRGKETILEIERDKVIAQMDKMIEEALK